MKQLDKLTNKAKGNKKTLLFLVILFIIGIIAGSLFITVLNESDKALVKEYLEKFIMNIHQNKLDYTTSFISSLISNLFYVMIIWLLGISVIGLPIILFLYFAKAFILGFSISSILFHYQFKGIVIAFCYIFPHHIINVLIFTLLVLYSMSLSIKISKTLIMKKSLDFRLIMKKYGMILGICLVGSIITSILEVFVMPTLIKFCMSIIS